MRRQRRYLTYIEGFQAPQNRAQIARELEQAYPESSQYRLVEVAEFWTVAWYLDMLSLSEIRRVLRRHRIQIPPLIQEDAYRIGRYLLSRWREPEVRQALRELPWLHRERMAQLAAEDQLEDLVEAVVTSGMLPGVWALYLAGVSEGRIEEVLRHLPPEEAEYWQLFLPAARAQMHRYLTEPFLLRRMSLQERRAFVRRMKSRKVRLRAMRRSLYSLSQERRALVGRTLQAERQALAELERLEGRQKAIREELARAEQAHAAALTDQAARFAAELRALRANLSTLRTELAEAAAERDRWAPCRFLAGLAVAVVGEQGHEPSYRALVESAGGRFVQTSALEKLNRIPDAVAAADLVILVTARAKHAAEWRLRKALKPGARYLRCPRPSADALERVLQTEVFARLAANSPSEGGEGDG